MQGVGVGLATQPRSGASRSHVMAGAGETQPLALSSPCQFS